MTTADGNTRAPGKCIRSRCCASRLRLLSSAVLAGLLDVALGNQTATLPTSEQNLDKEDKSTSAEDDEEDRLPSNDHDSRKVESGSGWSAFTVAFINRDPLADHLNIKDKTVHCVECNRSFVQSSTSNIGNWHRHCASSAHRRTPYEYFIRIWCTR